jgi:DNA polymerase I-like protein with 3'-5' exonuclease and polymerase domains
MTPLIHAIYTASLNAIPPSFRVFDVETTVASLPDGYDPAPYGPLAGRIVAFGAMDVLPGGPPPVPYVTHVARGPVNFDPICLSLNVGHNFKFDLQHMARHHGLHPLQVVSPGCAMWDCMVAEYILTGQVVKFAALRDLMMKYLGYSKADVIGENLAKGITPDKIEPSLLLDYLKDDLRGTADVFLAQWRVATIAQRRLIMVQSAATVAYAEMEYNGLVLDVPECVQRRDHHFRAVSDVSEHIKQFWVKALEVQGHLSDSALANTLDASVFTTNRAVSAAVFGEPPALKFKVPFTDAHAKFGFDARGGRRKWLESAVNNPFTYMPRITPEDIDETRESLLGAHGIYCVDDDVLARVLVAAEGKPSGCVKPIAKAVLAVREHAKLDKTYYQGLLDRHARYGDEIIHPKINQCLTDTGRTSSSNPNSQNLPAAVREVIRCGREGHKLVEVDWSQIEMCALAHCSKDPNLIRVLSTGGDLHYESGKATFKWRDVAHAKSEEEKENRRATKEVNFGLVYGGSAGTLAAKSGFPLATVRQLIDGFFTSFHVADRWQRDFYDGVVKAPDTQEVLIDEGLGCTVRRHSVTMPTGRTYVFTEKASPPWLAEKTGLSVSFAPTQARNYPIQGTATGDWVPLGVALLAEWVRGEKQQAILLRGVVHDSILCEIPDGWFHLVKSEMQEVLTTKVSEACRDLWGEPIAVPLKVEFHVGDYWSNRK